MTFLQSFAYPTVSYDFSKFDVIDLLFSIPNLIVRLFYIQENSAKSNKFMLLTREFIKVRACYY